MNIDEKLKTTGLSRERYECALKDICDKREGLNDMDWSEIQAKYNLPGNSDSYRKATDTIFGGAFVKAYMDEKIAKKQPVEDVNLTLEKIRKEKIKLQTLNTERSRIDRQEARQELFYENIGKACETLPLPNFKPLDKSRHSEDSVYDETKSYICCLADIHYGSTFKSEHNEYSREIAQERLEHLCGEVIEFINSHHLEQISILELGDSIQGILRLSDLRINDTEIVHCIVEVSRLIANFVNSISEYCVVDYYHVPSANHTQQRPLGSKPSELASEDYEYIISNYIKDLLRNNERVHVHLADEGKQYVKIELPRAPFQSIYAMHGHQFKGIGNSQTELEHWLGNSVDSLILGHFHGGLEKTAGEGMNDKDILVCPSFVGSDPYSDRLMRGAKAAAKIYGFSNLYGYTESYKIVLN